MRLAIDFEAQAMHLHILDGRSVKTVDEDVGILSDFDTSGRLIGVEVTNLGVLGKVPSLLKKHQVNHNIDFIALATAIGVKV